MNPLNYLAAYDWRSRLSNDCVTKKEEQYQFPPRNGRRGPSENSYFHANLQEHFKGHEGEWVLFVDGEFKGFGPLEVLVAKTPRPELFKRGYDIFLKKIISMK